MKARRIVLAFITALLVGALLPVAAVADSRSWGTITYLSPRGDALPGALTRVTIRSGGTNYAFRTSNSNTVYYLRRLNSSHFVKVSRNSWVRAMQHGDVNPEPGGRVTSWSWRGSGSARYRYARVIYGDQNR